MTMTKKTFEHFALSRQLLSAADLQTHWTKDERSQLLYAESCAVDQGGLMEQQKMNLTDGYIMDRLQAAGILTWGRIPGRVLTDGPRVPGKDFTHWCELKPEGWRLASLGRQLRSYQKGPMARATFDWINARREAIDEIDNPVVSGRDRTTSGGIGQP